MKDENQQPQPWIDPALEARIVASVLGETSAFEAAEIERLVAAHPELALFKRRIETTHALVESAHRPENPKIQLSPERRRKLLETIGVPAVAPPKKIHALPAPTPWWSSPLLIRAAACLIMTGLAVALLSSITVYQSAPRTADFSGRDAGFMQSESVAISVPQSAAQPVAELPPMLADVPMEGRLFRPDAQSTPPSFASASTLSVPPPSAVGDDVRSRGNIALAPNQPNSDISKTEYADNKPAPAAKIQLWRDEQKDEVHDLGLAEERSEGITTDPGILVSAGVVTRIIPGSDSDIVISPQAAPPPPDGTVTEELVLSQSELKSAAQPTEPLSKTATAPGQDFSARQRDQLAKAKAVRDYLNGSPDNTPAQSPNVATGWDSLYMFRGVDVLAKDSESQKVEVRSDSRPKDGEERDFTPADKLATATAAKEELVTAGNRSEGAVISMNAVDALLFGTQADQSALVAPAPGAPAPMAEPVSSTVTVAENVINQPIYTMREGQPVEFDGFINYGSPIPTVTGGKGFTTQEVREFKYPTEFQPSQVEEVKKLLQEAKGFADTGRYDLATKRYEQTLATDPYNVAARRGMERINAARQKYATNGYNEARGRILMVDAGWELPVRRFDIGATTIIEQHLIDQSGKAQITRKLDEIVIPRIDFQDVTVRDALEFLKSRSAQLDSAEDDPTRKGVNVVLNLPEDAPENQARITLGLTDIPLGAAINYVASAANLKIKVEPYAISVVPQSTATEALVTKQYKVPPGFIPVPPATKAPSQLIAGAEVAPGSLPPTLSHSAAKEFLAANGLTFPPGATAYYLPGSNRLIVKNTQTNLDLVDTLTDTAQASPSANAQKAKGPENQTKAALAKPPYPQDEIPAANQPFSTFSLHVSDVSFQLAKDALARGTRPDPERIRAEEFYNAFDYNDPAPGAGEEVACRIEQAAHPFLQQRNLVRIAVKVAAAGRAANQPLRLTVLLDTSGSMEREDRAASVRRALQSLVSLLGPNDRVTLIGFARTPRLLAEDVPGDQGEKLLEAAARTPSQGGTNLEEALALASELALKHKQPNGQNRIVLLTDGAANLGNANPERLAAQIEKTRQQGISFDACGVGAKGLNDEILEALTRKGDGRYYFLNKPEDADEGFARQLAGAFRPAAENVKVQVVFNPARVGRYRLIGFEKHLLKQEDFRNDKVQAAELSAEEAGVALYQVEPLPDGSGELGEVFVRFRDPATGRMVERSWTMPYEERTPSFDQASPSLQLAATAALLAEKLRGNEQIDLEALAPVLNGLRARYGEQQRVSELLQMFERVRR